MSELNKLYKKAVLAHNKNPHNYGKPETWTHHAEGLNAICGDLVEVYLTIADDRLVAVNFAGESCAIAMASASMMTELSTGLTLQDWQNRFNLFKQLMDPNNEQVSYDELGEVNTLITVKKFPSRIKSATLCWYAVDAAIKGQSSTTTE
ncbi:SUF system NifU family Fe-S cluster assembly protein [Marinicella sp. S1101]|uniref:Fe-S cluster assembly sulfur transfer protein SufU n=1 Tax=Marinicella marina TaxID=2996016 RepID=UPI002260FF0B|nr:SUF system NifU family Fe-S cluster assembly protein [Marinicella marina]MCX7554666.1 SUF system NifU family Fe-S cluster assembly protein [Marinicella marina]MDJ1140731.1 SUF system NifU family Fe-S cluster assembly protein [Marinicella marina]